MSCHYEVVNLVKILEFVSFLFGDEWHCRFDQINGFVNTNQNLVNPSDYEKFAINLESLLKIIKDSFEPYRTHKIDNNYQPYAAEMITLKNEILEFCHQKCRDIIQNNESILNNVCNKFINCTDDSKLQSYFCKKFDDKKSIFSWKVFFGMKYFKNDVLNMKLF